MKVPGQMQACQLTDPSMAGLELDLSIVSHHHTAPCNIHMPATSYLGATWQLKGWGPWRDAHRKSS